MVAIPHYINKRLLLLLNVALVVLIVVCIYFTFFAKAYETAKTRTVELPQSKVSQRLKENIQPLSYYSIIFKRDFRQELSETKIPDAPVMQTTMPSNINLQLLGTIIESGHTYALVRMPNGKEKLIELGQVDDGIELVAASDDSATFRSGGKMFDVDVIKRVPPQLPPNQVSSPRDRATRSTTSGRVR